MWIEAILARCYVVKREEASLKETSSNKKRRFRVVGLPRKIRKYTVFSFGKIQPDYGTSVRIMKMIQIPIGRT